MPALSELPGSSCTSSHFPESPVNGKLFTTFTLLMPSQDKKNSSLPKEGRKGKEEELGRKG